MSDNIPFEIQAEIIKRLPVKSLVQFRSVSKRWKSLIDSSKFIAGYCIGLTHPQHVRVWYYDPVDEAGKYVSFVDKAIDQQKFASIHPVLPKIYYGLQKVGSSKGLLCLYGYYKGPGHSHYNFGTEIAVLFNILIRKSVAIVVPCIHGWKYETVLGFGVCPITSDPTIVKITNVNIYSEKNGRASLPRPVEVFTLSTGSWRIPFGNLPNKLIDVRWSQVVIDKFIYWLAFDKMVATGGEFSSKNAIMSFDMTTHDFRVVDLPDCLADEVYGMFSVSKLWESLVVLEANLYKEHVWVVWMMDHGFPNLFTKLLTINLPYESIRVLGFSNSGEPIMKTRELLDFEGTDALVIYDPSSDDILDTGIDGNFDTYFVDSYIKTPLLLDYLDCSVIPVSRL